MKKGISFFLVLALIFVYTGGNAFAECESIDNSSFKEMFVEAEQSQNEDGTILDLELEKKGNSDAPEQIDESNLQDNEEITSHLETPIIYLNGENGSNNNSGLSPDNAVASIEKAYELALSANSNALINDSNAEAVILLCGTTTLDSNFNISRSYSHLGRLVITCVYGEENYSDSAKLQFSASGEQAVQLGGPTSINHITLNRLSTSAYTIYAPGELLIGESVINECNGVLTQQGTTNSAMQGKCIVRGGYYNAQFVGDISICILSGTYWFASGANATASGGIIGDVSLYIGGSAWVATVVPGTQSAACTITNSVVTVAESATVNTITASGDYGNIENSRLNIYGGTINNIIATRSGKNGTCTHFTVTVKDGCELNLQTLLPTGTEVNVEYTGRLFLTENDHLTEWVGCGTIYFNNEWHRNQHVWDEDGYCTNCRAHRYTVYVSENAPEYGDGYSPELAVETLEKAYQSVLHGEDNLLVTSPSATGTLVLCGDLTIDGYSFNLSGEIEHIGIVTITSCFENVDYRTTNDATLNIGSIPGNSQVRFQCGGPTVFDEITINRINRSDGSVPGSLTIYGTNYLVMGNGVKTNNTNWEYSAPLTQQEAETTKLSAHMGYQTAGPGNSIPAFRAAGAAGFWAIETDVRTTSDGVLVCCHDATIDNTYNGNGAIASMTYEQILQYKLDTGNCLSQYSDDELRMPKFTDYLEICHQYNALPFIEIKSADLSQVINEAKQYFDEEDIIISSTSMTHLQQARAVSDEVFIHHIFSTESQINTLAQLGNSGMSFNITAADLATSSGYAEAQRLIDEAHAAGVKVCLRAGDSCNAVRMMNEVGVDYIPTNTTTPDSLSQPSYSSKSGGKIFIRGGYGYKSTDEDIYIYLYAGQYDFAAASNAERAATGNYHVTVGGDAFVSRLICGPTYQGNGTVQRSTLNVSGNAVVNSLYSVGDYGNVAETNIYLTGGTVKSLLEKRDNTNGAAQDINLTISETADIPETVSISASCITGSRQLIIDGIVGKAMRFDSGWNSLRLINNSSVTVVGIIPVSVAVYIEDGSTLIYPE